MLPVYTNQKVNEYLKTIAENCGINKKLTFHCARHTFATTVTLGNNVSMESVSKMLGHKSIKTTQHYAKILDSKVSQDMGSLKLVLEKKMRFKRKMIKNSVHSLVMVGRFFFRLFCFFCCEDEVI
ncbi:tyrosine-type recombinase/integrase [Kaistella anthropi]|nr:tyrosine-type recombinase/integrase [Kaistella anthropi]